MRLATENNYDIREQILSSADQWHRRDRLWLCDMYDQLTEKYPKFYGDSNVTVCSKIVDQQSH